MFQRIQTLFLFLIILSMIALCFMPIWTKTDPNLGHSYTLYAWHLKEINSLNNQARLVTQPYVGIGILAIIVALLALYALLRYDNRLKQLQICALNSLLMIGILGMIVYLIVKNDAKLLIHVKGHYQIGFVVIIVAVISNLLANQFIKRDEQLVREAERIR